MLLLYGIREIHVDRLLTKSQSFKAYKYDQELGEPKSWKADKLDLSDTPGMEVQSEQGPLRACCSSFAAWVNWCSSCGRQQRWSISELPVPQVLWSCVNYCNSPLTGIVKICPLVMVMVMQSSLPELHHPWHTVSFYLCFPWLNTENTQNTKDSLYLQLLCSAIWWGHRSAFGFCLCHILTLSCTSASNFLQLTITWQWEINSSA